MKICRRCQEGKPLSEFYRDKSGKDGHRSICKDCHKLDAAERYNDNPEHYKNYSREYRERNRERLRLYKIMQKYGLSPEEYARLVEESGNRCKICGGEPNGKELCVDHNHDTGQVRGLLCEQCNQGLGKFQDNPELLRSAIEYLENKA